MNFDAALGVTLGAYILICVLFALIRGHKKSGMRLVGVVLSAVLAFITIMLLKHYLGNEFLTQKTNELLLKAELNELVAVATISPLFEEVVLKTTLGLVSPVLLLALFLAYCIVTYVIYFILTLIFRKSIKKKSKEGRLKPLRATLNGSLQGLVVAAVFLFPIVSYMDVVPVITPKVQQSVAFNDTQKELFTTVDKTVADINKTTVVSTYRKCNVKALSNQIMSFDVTVNEQKINVNMNDEIGVLADLALGVMELSRSPVAEYGETEAAAIQTLGENFAKSKVLPVIAAELIHSATGSWKQNEAFLGNEKPGMGDALNPLFTKLIDVFYESSKSPSTLGEDIITTSKLAGTFAKSGVFAATAKTEENPNAVFDCIAKDGVISEITVTLNQNPRMKVLIPEITNLGIKTLASSLGIAENDAEIYTSILNNIATQISSSKTDDTQTRIESLKPVLKNEFENAGITVEEEYIGILSDALIEDFGDFEGEITPEFIAEFFDVYSNVVNQDGGGTVSGVSFNGGVSFIPLVSGAGSTSFTPLAGGTQTGYTYPKYSSMTALSETGAGGAAAKSKEIISSASAESAEKAEALTETKAWISSLRSAETVNINRITMEDFLVPSDFIASNPEAEALALEATVKEIVSVVSTLKGGQVEGAEAIKSLAGGLGDALDGLASTEMYGNEKTSNLFTAIIQSSIVRDTTKLTIQETVKLAEKQSESTESYSSVMNAFSGTVGIIVDLQNEKISENIEALITDLTPANVVIINEIITVERIKSIGLPETKAENAATILKALFTNLGNLTDGETFDKEAAAVEKIIGIGIAAKNSNPENTKELFGEDGILGCSSEDMVDNILASTAVCETIKDSEVNPFGITMSNENKEAIKATLESKQTPENSDKIHDIASFLGIEGFNNQ